ncbi:MAG TPA: hypothetical protein VLD59_16425 [Steroidobacteraceae bacterium]|nr:hypothetical protein [Steroidobacteraceae bacterium]
MPGERFHPVHTSFKAQALAGVVLATALLSIAPERGDAVGRIDIDIGDLVGSDWSARNVSIALELPGAEQTIARVFVKQATLMPEIGALRDLSITCPNPLVREPLFACKSATVSGQFGRFGRQQLRASLEYRSDNETLRFAIDGLRVAQGRVHVTGQWLESGWTLAAKTEGLALASLRELMKPWFALPDDLTVEGKASLDVTLHGADTIATAQVGGTLNDVTANNAAGTLATDKLNVILDTELKADGADWIIRAKIAARSGQAYSDPIFLDFAQQPATATVAGRWIPEPGILQLSELKVGQKDTVMATLAGELDFGGEMLLRKLHVDLERLEFPVAFTSLMLPFLLDTELKDLKMEGHVSGVVEMEAGLPAAFALELHEVNATGNVASFRALDGQVNWLSSARRDAPGGAASRLGAAPSRLEWQGGALYGISTGATRIHFVTAGADFRLLEPTELPILDGGLAIEELSVRELGEPQMSVRFAGELKPISVTLLSRAFGWPEFAGTIAGRIPQVSLEEDVLSLGGDLDAEVFGGQVKVNALKLQNPLGDYPQLSANITMRNLDLEAVTGTFSFGKITGRLNADIRDLELFQWAPIKFDARLYTPPGDKSRHLISQRAVNNLSNIGGGGGGVTAALSSGFLRFFEDFRYDRLGLSCRLENEICLMDGIERQQGESYYIVKGSGLPRIDIIGNARRVSWNRLVSQLTAIQASGGPVVQ